MQVVFRHGDRAPGYNCRLHPAAATPDSSAVAEEDFWRAQLPDASSLVGLCARFPVRDRAGAPPTDSAIFPWGALSSAGALQLYGVGCALAKRYRLPPVSSRSSRVQCTASNYQRTQQSSQNLLAGLFDTAGGEGAQAEGLADVDVLPLAADPINPFDRPSKWLQRRCVELLESDAAFGAAEKTVLGPKAALTDGRLPAFDGQPLDEVKWINFFDYYQCRDRMPAARLPAATERPPLLEGTDKVGLRATTHAHVCWRFGQWYADASLLALAAGPLLREIIAQMRAAERGLRSAEAAGEVALAPRLRLFGGHDVSLLALEWALRTPRALSRGWWPPYASTLAFELLQRVGASAEDEFFVRVVADSKEVLQVGYEAARTTARDGLIPLSHWDRLVPLDTFVSMLTELAVDAEMDAAVAAGAIDASEARAEQ